jgi:hypothetical protein
MKGLRDRQNSVVPSAILSTSDEESVGSDAYQLPLYRNVCSIQVLVLVAFLFVVATTGASIWGINQGNY